MPKLLLFIPFTRGDIGDLRTNAADLVQAAVPCVINNVQISNIINVFAGEEVQNPVLPGDILVVHAHGGQGDANMSDNNGEEATMDRVLTKMNILQAHNASMVFFLVCFSATQEPQEHIAPVWAARNPGIPVFGATEVVEGAIAQITRQGTIRNAMFFENDPRTVQL